MHGQNLTYKYIIRDNEGERRLSENDFPIVIGSGASADIHIEGTGAEREVAYIGLSQAHPFVQPASTDTPVLHNAERLKGSAWLYQEDVVQIGNSRLRLLIEAQAIVFQVSKAASDQIATPRVVATATGEPVAIQPISFRANQRRSRSTAFSVFKWFGWMALAAFMLVLTTSVWFDFSAKRVILQVDPQPDEISISGGLASPRFGHYYLLRPGDYILHASKECFESLQQPFQVGEADDQQLHFTIQKQPGRLTIQAHQEDNPSKLVNEAQIVLNAENVGTTPATDLAVSAGQHQLEIRTPNYQNFKTDITVTGCGREQAFNFALVPNWSPVVIGSIPEGARVEIDGKPVGNTPLEIELAAGSYRLTLKAERFKDWQTQLLVKPNQPQRIEDIRLLPADGRLAVRTQPAGANVIIDKRYAGQTPLKTKVSPNTVHLVQISKPGYDTVSRKIKIEVAGSKTLNLDLKPLRGIINFKVEPSDATLLVNGKQWGPVPPKLQLHAVAHKLEFKKSGYLSQSVQITPRPGFPQELKIALKKKGASLSAPVSMITAKNGYALKLIRPGTYTMGASRREQGRRSNETLRKIKLLRPFYMGTTEVTNEEFKAFLASHNSGAFKQKSLNRKDQPVVQVTWEQAAMFCNWLSARDSLPPAYKKKGDQIVVIKPMTVGYRLPTEAEWEFCARYSGKQTARKYPWGNTFPPKKPVGNFADVSAKGLLNTYLKAYNDGYPVTAAPAKFKPNALGLYDMGGNVAEWCHDYYSIYPYKANTVYIDPTGPDSGKHRVAKGAGWKDAAISALRLAYRDYNNSKRNDLGFRICRYAE